MQKLQIILRTLSFLLDMMLILLVFAVLDKTLLANMTIESQKWLIHFVIWMLYSVLCEAFFGGQTIGKIIAKIKVETDEKNEIFRIALRNLAKTSYIFPVMGAGLFMLNFFTFKKKKLSFHDWVAQTNVTFINVKKEQLNLATNN